MAVREGPGAGAARRLADRARRWRWPRRSVEAARSGGRARTRCGSTRRELTLGRLQRLAEGRRRRPRPRSTRRRPRSTRSARASRRCAEQVDVAEQPGRAAADATSTTRSSARRSAAWRSRRTRSRARWSRRSRPAAASRAPASARSWTCARSRSRWTSTRATSTASSRSSRSTAVLDAYPDWQIPAHVITTVPTADRQKATVLVRIGFDELDPRILPDMGVKVTFLREAERRPRRPASAAGHARAEGARCARTDGERRRVRRRATDASSAARSRSAAPTATSVEVIAGLHAGERVVVVAAGGTADGAQRSSVKQSKERRDMEHAGPASATSTRTSRAAASASTCCRASTSRSRRASSSR